KSASRRWIQTDRANQQHEEAVVDNAPPDVIEGATIVDAFRANVRSIPERPAMRRRTHNGWEVFTWADYGQAVAQVTAGLADLGIGPGERIAILSGNRVEWHLADIGALANGCGTVSDDPHRRVAGPSGRGRAIPAVPTAQPRGRAWNERIRPHHHRRRDVVRAES